MPPVREVTENHGDYEYHVEKNEGKVLCYRKPLNSVDAPDEQLVPEELPSESLKEAFETYKTQVGVDFI